MKKGVYGLGDSFMWGEGLYFYSQYENLPFKKTHSFDMDEMRYSFLEFKNRHRYITKVGNYLDTWSLTHENNGGDNVNTIEYLKSSINEDKLRYEDIGLIIYQFTGPERAGIPIEKQFNILLENIKIWEKYNIEYYFLSWLPTYEFHPLYRKYFLKKHIWIENPYNKEVRFGWYPWTDSPMDAKDVNPHHTKGLTVHDDFCDKGYQKGDIHLNIKGHDMVANSIIKKLKQDNFTL